MIMAVHHNMRGQHSLLDGLKESMLHSSVPSSVDGGRVECGSITSSSVVADVEIASLNLPNRRGEQEDRDWVEPRPKGVERPSWVS